MLNLVILILAAGAAARMRGEDKVLMTIDGEAQLTRIARTACQTGRRVLVALPPEHPDRATALAGLPVETVIVPDTAEGLSASIRTGAWAAGPCRLMILPADMPELEAADLLALAGLSDHTPDRILRAASAEGAPGHPVILPGDLLPDLVRLTGDEAVHALLLQHARRVVLVALKGNRAVTNLDTPEDWAEWLAARSASG